MTTEKDSIIHEYMEVYKLEEDRIEVPSVNKGFIYHYGPYMAMSDRYKDTIDKLSKYFPEVAYMKYGAALMQNSNGTCKTIRNNVKEVVSESAKILSDDYVKVFENKAKAMIEYIRNYQYENNVLESAMINMSPIVPYAGEMKKQWNEAAYKNLDEEEVTRNYASYFLSLVDTKELPELLHGILFHNLFFILGNSNLSIDAEVSESDINSTVSIKADKLLYVNDTNNRDAQVKAYYFFSYCLLHNIPKNTIRNYLNNFIVLVSRSIESLTEISELFKSMSNDNYTIADELWDEMGMSDDMKWKITELEEENATKDEYAITYDIQALLSYIYSHQEINCDDYTNANFLDRAKGMEISNVAYYNNHIMSCIANGKYLIIPFIDIGQDYKMKLLCMDEEGQIFIKSDLEFE